MNNILDLIDASFGQSVWQHLVLSDLTVLWPAMAPGYRRDGAVLAQLYAGSIPSEDAVYPTWGAGKSHLQAVFAACLMEEPLDGLRLHAASVISRAFRLLDQALRHDKLIRESVRARGGTERDQPAPLIGAEMAANALCALVAACTKREHRQPGLVWEKNSPANAPKWAGPMALSLLSHLAEAKTSVPEPLVESAVALAMDGDPQWCGSEMEQAVAQAWVTGWAAERADRIAAATPDQVRAAAQFAHRAFRAPLTSARRLDFPAMKLSFRLGSGVVAAPVAAAQHAERHAEVA